MAALRWLLSSVRHHTHFVFWLLSCPIKKEVLQLVLNAAAGHASNALSHACEYYRYFLGRHSFKHRVADVLSAVCRIWSAGTDHW